MCACAYVMCAPLSLSCFLPPLLPLYQRNIDDHAFGAVDHTSRPCTAVVAEKPRGGGACVCVCLCACTHVFPVCAFVVPLELRLYFPFSRRAAGGKSENKKDAPRRLAPRPGVRLLTRPSSPSSLFVKR
jgi:hypothetical protein